MTAESSSAATKQGTVLSFLRDTHDAFYFYKRPHCEVGEFIEINRTKRSVFLHTQNVYRVDKINWMYTDLTCLASGERVRWHNTKLCRYTSMVCWSYCPVRFQIMLPVPVNTTGGIFWDDLLESKIQQFANDNPGEWFVADTSYCDPTPDGYRVMIQHREKWGQLDLVLKSREKLIAYCKELTEELRPADASDDFAITVFP
ncbi:hypothetical protein FisN_14Lu110 [Fistulifera solaris]|uniref:Uncharacterized protein n=1 Tax=Fistulifera solaris TaxID=1519565 RepID=A0A1Z5J9N5_FISSO|nr:hypothetical protein FisN_14Lu110 [Fistulifera solaris]|eukprot:GAX10602.1 hypothetical protein FisN_14Lu110 [Fistulifera solaris]